MQWEWFVGIPVRLGGRDFLLDVTTTRYWIYGKLLVFIRSSLGGRDLFDRSTRFKDFVLVLRFFYAAKYKGAIFSQRKMELSIWRSMLFKQNYLKGLAVPGISIVQLPVQIFWILRILS